MDPEMLQLARELTEAMSAAVSSDPRVAACRDKARAAGFDLRVSLDAKIGVVPVASASAVTRSAAHQPMPVTGVRGHVRRPPAEMTPGDRRFLKSLRISADETTEKEVE
jgi:hypothetical protein